MLNIGPFIQKGCLALVNSARPWLSRCRQSSLLQKDEYYWISPNSTALYYRHYSTGTNLRFSVIYDPQPDMTEAEVKHIKLNPVPEHKTPRGQRYALLLSFNGQGYYGMQRNMTGCSIEDNLLGAMLAAGLITEEELFMPQLFSFQRASRTDKGVSAARLLVSADFRWDKSEIQTRINQHLNDQIRVMAVYRTTKSFNCKHWCDSRTYSYMCPTFAFAPCSEITRESYRISEDVLEEVRRLLALYKGVHNFHNFTSRVNANENRAIRNILDVECGQPFEQNGLEWVIIKMKGKSFMLHQIRKMIGLIIAVSRGVASIDFISQALSHDVVYLPIAPGIGLVLEDQHFDNYNKKFASDGSREPLNWDHQVEIIEEFRKRNIFTPIVNTELNERSMFKWLMTLYYHTFEVYKEELLEDSQERNGRKMTRNSSVLASLAWYMHQHNVNDSSSVNQEDNPSTILNKQESSKHDLLPHGNSID